MFLLLPGLQLFAPLVLLGALAFMILPGLQPFAALAFAIAF